MVATISRMTLAGLFSLFLVFGHISVAESGWPTYNRVSSPPQTYRGPTGRVVGRAYDNGGGFSYYDNSGRKQGYSRGNSLYGSSGRYIGSAPKVNGGFPFNVKQ